MDNKSPKKDSKRSVQIRIDPILHGRVTDFAEREEVSPRTAYHVLIVQGLTVLEE